MTGLGLKSNFPNNHCTPVHGQGCTLYSTVLLVYSTEGTGCQLCVVYQSLY